MDRHIFSEHLFGTAIEEPPHEREPFRQFEIDVRRLLEERYPPGAHRIDERDAIRHSNGSGYASPDFVVYLGDQCEAVADAKFRRKLSVTEARKVVKYARRLGASEALVYVPADCHIDAGAQKLEDTRQIVIIQVLR